MPSLKIIFNLFYPPTDQLKKFIEDNKSSDGVYFPINGGSTIDDEWSENFLQKDSVGDNISHLNSILNEMTSIYWFWKNAKLPEYVGFSHYRRTFKQSDFEDYQNYDIIVSKPIWSSDKISLAYQYKNYHVLSDLQTCIDLIRDEFSYGWGEGFRKYLLHSGINLAPCNMFIMKKELFEEWCGFVFPILFKLKEKICDTPEFQKRDNYQKRALCFLTERMFGYWYFLKKNSGLKTKELDIVEHLEYKPKNVNERGDFSNKLPRVALVALAKDEENYLKEWVDYNLKIGFTDIYIYQNRWRYDRGDINDSRVHFEIYDNERPQIPCYNMCLKKYNGMYDFIAFFDIDEFLYVKSGESVPEFLSKYTDKEAIYVNWRIFGDNGLEKVENGDYSVLNRFTKCDDKLFRLGKPILNIGKTGTSLSFNNPHILVYSDRPTTEFRPFDPLGKIQVKCGSLDNNTFDEPCELYHYRNKTWEETVKRRLNTTDVFWPDNFKSRTDIDTIKNDFKNHNMNVMMNFNISSKKPDIVTFLHSGDAGDIVASLPTVKSIVEKTNSKARLYIDVTGGTTCNSEEINKAVGRPLNFNKDTYDFLSPLLKFQYYVESVNIFDKNIKDKIDFNLNTFRASARDKEKNSMAGGNLDFLHKVSFGLKPEYTGPWLKCGDTNENPKIVIGRSTRYQSAHLFFGIYEKTFNDNGTFIGTEFEYECFKNAFCHCNPKFYKCKDALDAANLINKSEMFVCNSTLFFWIGVGLGHKNIIHELPIDITPSYYKGLENIRYVIGGHFVK